MSRLKKLVWLVIALPLLMVACADSDTRVPACAPSREGSGVIKEYADSLSQLSKGANGAWRMKEALCVYLLDIAPQIRNRDGSITPFVGAVPVSDPVPSFQITSQAATMSSGGSVTLSVSGILKDPFSEMVVDQGVAIQDFTIRLNGKFIRKVPISYSAGSPPWTQRVLNGSFSTSVVLDSIKDGVFNVRLEATNGKGNTGIATIVVPIERNLIDGGAVTFGNSLKIGLKQEGQGNIGLSRWANGAWLKQGILINTKPSEFTGTVNMDGTDYPAVLTISNPGDIGIRSHIAKLSLGIVGTSALIMLDGNWAIEGSYSVRELGFSGNNATAFGKDLYFYTIGNPKTTEVTDAGTFFPIRYRIKYKHPLSSQLPNIRIGDSSVTLKPSGP